MNNMLRFLNPNAAVAQEITNQRIEQHILFECAAAKAVSRCVGNEQEALVDACLPEVALQVVVELRLLLLGCRNDRADVFAGDLDEAEVEIRSSALTETDVEFAQDSFLRSLRKIARSDVMHPSVEVRLAGRLAVPAGPVEVDVF